jgi:uncharacterized membrane protein
VSDRRLRVGIGSLALLGASLTGYLLYVRHTGVALACTTDGCETVQSSRYAEPFGVPVAALGLVAYLTLFAMSCMQGEVVRLAQAAVALTAFAFSGYLVYVQLHMIGAVCEWCLASDVVTTGVTGLVLLRLRANVHAV